MKKFLLALTLIVCTTAFAASPIVDEKIKNDFNTAFPKAEKVTWFEADSHYEVLFENDLVKCRMWYDKDGNVTKTERYYAKDGLCPFILAKLNKKFDGKKIFGITEVNNEEGIVYHIILEDAKHWYHVNADGSGNLRMTKRLNKA